MCVVHVCAQVPKPESEQNWKTCARSSGSKSDFSISLHFETLTVDVPAVPVNAVWTCVFRTPDPSENESESSGSASGTAVPAPADPADEDGTDPSYHSSTDESVMWLIGVGPRTKLRKQE